MTYNNNTYIIKNPIQSKLKTKIADKVCIIVLKCNTKIINDDHRDKMAHKTETEINFS